MKVKGKDYRTVWMEGRTVFMIEQNLLPFEFSIHKSRFYKDTCQAIRTMIIRGAGAIGAAAGYAMAQACLEANAHDRQAFLDEARRAIESTRPTARNLFYAVERVYAAALISTEMAVAESVKIADEDAAASKRIGEYGNELIRDGFGISTHCNAGWLAFVDFGTALSPVYKSHSSGKKIFVFADETRPRGQGARLTAWELHNAGIPHAIIPDNATAWYMSQGKIDMVIVGADRIAANGDTANKIGTLEKAIAARHFNIPFYVAAPTSTFDPDCPDGNHIIIEERDPDEVLYQEGLTDDGRKEKILVCSPGSTALNPAFDVTPAGLITGFITEKGIEYKHEKVSVIDDPDRFNRNDRI
jgi:methylthioribose-1-phosphate isomerase